MKANIYNQLVRNWSKEIDNFIREYNNNKREDYNYIHGFQKDVIQNSFGAVKKNKNFECIFKFETGKNKLYLLVQDKGTCGLEGSNLSQNEINEFSRMQKDLPPKERLARFSSMNFSGGNQGAGLYGQGKKMYAAVSKEKSFYFESISVEGYRVNHLKNGEVLPKALEGDEAKEFIKNETGLEPIKDMGTRIIIPSPKKLIQEEINSGVFEKKISETWWKIIQKYDAKILVNDNYVKVPKEYSEQNYIREFCPKAQILVEPNYNIKKFGLFVCKNLDIRFQGIYFYRKDMKIGKFDLSGIVPDDIRNKVYGFVELKEDWENELAEIENTTHYDVVASKKRNNAYKFLNNYVIDKFKSKMTEWKYIKTSESKNKELTSIVEDVAEEVQGLFSEMGYEASGQGKKKNSFDVRLKNIKYPSDDTRRVDENESISFGFDIKNNSTEKRTFVYNIYVESISGTIYQLMEKSIEILEQDKFNSSKIDININSSIASKFEQNKIILEVRRTDLTKTLRKELIFFYIIPEPQFKEDDITFTLFNHQFPSKGSKRVNTNEKVSNLVYRVKNKLNKEIKLRIRLQSLYGNSKSKNEIEEINSIDIKISPLGDNTFDLGDVVYKEKYLDKISKGKIYLRGSLIAKQDISNEYYLGTRIHKIDLTTFFNYDEKNGNINDFEAKTENDENSVQRSRIEQNQIIINLGHPAISRFEDTEYYKQIIRDEIIKQYVLYHIRKGRISILELDQSEYDKKSEDEIRELILYKIEKIYHQSFKGRSS